MARTMLAEFGPIKDQLAPGETLLAGGIGLAPGGMRRHAAATGFGGVVGVVAASIDKPTSGHVELPDKFVVGLTNQRLLFCHADSRGRPVALSDSIPLTDITSFVQSSGGVIIKHNTITLHGGREVVFDSARAGVGKAMNDLVEKAQPLIVRA